MKSKVGQLFVGVVAGCGTVWAVFSAVGYTFYRADISIKVLSSTGILIAIGEITLALLPYWILRRRHSDIARGFLIGVAIPVIGILLLLLLPFSEL